MGITQRFKGNGSERIRQRLLGFLTRHTGLVAFACLLWLLLRSGRKPSRLRYPCQQLAAAQCSWVFAGAALPAALRVPGYAGKGWREAAWLDRRRILACMVVTLLALGLFAGYSARSASTYAMPPETRARMAAAASALSIAPRISASSEPSDIFVAQGVTAARADRGVRDLMAVMASAGKKFYRSPQMGLYAGPGGIIGPQDVVVIKVNAQWDERGMTNTDVVKGLVEAIVNHPDGFGGEVVIAENAQWREPSFLNSPDANNAEDRTQSFLDVAAAYSGSHLVSISDWTVMRKVAVGEFDQGDDTGGFVVDAAHAVSYPKFTTTYGTRVSMRKGIWDGSSYDNGRLKLINVPVLKSHPLTGVTAACKHFMGFWSYWVLGYDTTVPASIQLLHDRLIEEGVMGSVMAYGRFPDLSIIDAVWSSVDYLTGELPGVEAPYEEGVETALLLASTDPVALDYYASKRVLFPISGYGRHDPDNANAENPGPGTYSDATPSWGYPYNALRQMLESTRDVLRAAGYRVTMDEAEMNVHTGAWYLAEGYTGGDFDTWVLVQNPGSEDTTVTLSFQLPPGSSAPDFSFDLPAGTRRSIHLDELPGLSATDVSTRVSSPWPVVAERAVYFDYQGKRGGHDSIGYPGPL